MDSQISAEPMDTSPMKRPKVHTWQVHEYEDEEFGPIYERGVIVGPFEVIREQTPGDRTVHIWLGPLGAHIFWPDFWKSRPDWLWRPNAKP
ncbi:MAG: hypothetical protein JJE13_13060 [Thermoleophilia bacterium]|nr:hypothetical protein [Thermoleophilia bacterium]